MARARVFISHSTRTEEAEAYLSALTKAFEEEGTLEFPHDPFWLDREKIEPGDLWRTKIFEAMEESHAAVLLLSKHAVHASHFVQIEASYLTVRSVKGLPIILVLIDVDVKDFMEGIWRELDVAARQMIKNCSPQEAAAQTLAFLKRNLDLDRIAPRNPTERLRAAIARDLKRAFVCRDDVLMLASEIAGLTEESHRRALPAGDDDELRRWLAKVLMSATPELLETVLRGLKDICSDDTGPLIAILNRIAPRWVDEKTAKLIGFIVRGRPEDRNFAISVANEWTLQAYVCQAKGCRYGEYVPLEYAGHEREIEGDSIEHDAASIERFVLDQLELDPSRDDLKDRYFEQQEEDWPIVVSLREEWWPPHPLLVSALRKRLSKVTFRFSPVAGRPNTEAMQQLASPQVDVENDAFMRHKRLRKMLR